VKVLSLAWKYHPAITSGVGVACEGLNNALSKIVDITAIYPSVSKIKVEEEIVFSGEDLSEEQLKIISEDYVDILENGNIEIAIRLDPYFTVPAKTIKSTTRKGELTTEEKIYLRSQRNEKSVRISEKLIYDDVDVFGENVKDKIFLYNRLVETLAWNIPFDIIHAHDWMTFLAGIYLKDRFHKPLVLHVHSLEYDRVGHKDVAWVYDVERFAMSKADMVIAGSEYTRGIIESSYGLSTNKVKVVYNALTPSSVRMPSYSGLKGKFKVLFAGRIDGNKGLEYFIEIARTVLKKTKEVDFIVVGRGKRELKFDQLAGFREIEKNFHYLGFVERDELFGLYQTCDVLCMPSISEPFGLTAIEAASMGLPVILSSKTGAAEILNGTPTADFWDIERFAKLILNLKKDSKMREQIIALNKKAIEKLSWENSAQRLKKIFYEVLRW
jgi:glycogen synthase